MAGIGAGVSHARGFIGTHLRIIWALLMREMSTRYGRNDIGFLWVIAEPIVFASAVATLYSFIRAPFENGIPIVPFTVTGYMALILVRQMVGFAVSSVKVNNALLYHRQITPLHLFIARCGMEFAGVSLAYIVIVFILNLAGIMGLPKELLAFIGGWVLLSWMSFGLALIMGALGELFEFVERFVQVITYILIPLSGAFYMAASIPPSFRETVLKLPFIHAFEIMRGAYFGRFVTTYYDLPYAIAWAMGLSLAGLLFVQFVRSRVEVL